MCRLWLKAVSITFIGRRAELSRPYTNRYVVVIDRSLMRLSSLYERSNRVKLDTVLCRHPELDVFI